MSIHTQPHDPRKTPQAPTRIRASQLSFLAIDLGGSHRAIQSQSEPLVQNVPNPATSASGDPQELARVLQAVARREAVRRYGRENPLHIVTRGVHWNRHQGRAQATPVGRLVRTCLSHQRRATTQWQA